MSGAPNTCGCCCFEEGDWVECKLDTNLFGIVISSTDWERFYSVQLAGSLEIRQFHAATLRHMDPEDDGLPPIPDAVDSDNVVRGVDFTKARDLRNTTTKGAA